MILIFGGKLSAVCWKDVFTFINLFCTFSKKNQLGTFVWVLFLGFPFCFTGLLSVPRPIPRSPDYRGYLESLESSQSIPLHYFFKIILANLLSLHLHINFKFILSIKKSCWDFDRNCVKTVYQFEKNWHLHQGLPLHEHGMPLHLFKSLISSTDTGVFNRWVLHVLLGLHLIILLFWSIMKGIVYLI